MIRLTCHATSYRPFFRFRNSFNLLGAYLIGIGARHDFVVLTVVC